jgi:hypothetical protein
VASRYRRSSPERTSYLAWFCYRSFRRMRFCLGDERGALEHLIKPSKARTGCCRKTRKLSRRSREAASAVAIEPERRVGSSHI